MSSCLIPKRAPALLLFGRRTMYLLFLVRWIAAPLSIPSAMIMQGTTQEQGMTLPQVDRAVSVCKRVVSAFSNTWKRKWELAVAQGELGLPYQLITETMNRWSSRQLMIDRPMWQDMDVLESISKAMRPLTEFTNALSGKEYMCKLEAVGYQHILFIGKQDKKASNKWVADIITHLHPTPVTRNFMEKMRRAYEFILTKAVLPPHSPPPLPPLPCSKSLR